MELTLKIDLTEEQYNDLMAKSYKEIFETDSFKEALKETICTGMVNWFDTPNGKDVIRETLVGDNYYSSNMRQTETGRSILNEATKEYASKIGEPIQDFYRDLLTKVNLGNLLKEILYSQIIRSMGIGMKDSMEMIEAAFNTQSRELQDLREKLSHI